MLVFALPASARHYSLAVVDGDLHTATAITHAGDDRLFVAGKEGLIWIYRDDVRLPSPFLDIRDRVKFAPGDPESEQGLLSLAFHPSYATNGYFFVTYTDNNGDSVVARYSVSGPNPDHSPIGSERILMRITEFGPNHNVNHVAFGPDGLLYVGAGDGGYQPEPRCTGQQPDSLHGKILRVDVDQNVDSPPYYGIPASNPFLGGSPVLDEVWAMGLRNPWRFSWDRATGDFWMADVGQHRREELNFLPAGSPGGQNWGFKMMEGFLCLGNSANCSFPVPPCGSPAYSSPVLDYGRDDRHCAIIGGHVYRGSAIPALQGAYLAGDYCGATFLVHRDNSQFSFEELSKDLPKLITFGEDVAGETYVSVAGALYKLVGITDDGQVAFAAETYGPSEAGGSTTLVVKRTGGTAGPVSVQWTTVHGTAGAGDYVAASGVLSWADGDGADKLILVTLTNDSEQEGTESFRVVLSAPTGASLGTPAETSVQIVDDETGQGPCLPADTVLCLAGDRFRVTVAWRDYQGQTGEGHAVPLDYGPSGFMYFFEPNNIEMLVKTLDGCAINGHFWVYAAATTDVEYTLRVIDTRNGRQHEYRNPLGVASPTVNDIQAFACD